MAIDADTKLLPSWLVGERTLEDCDSFLWDVERRLRPDTRLQLSTDGLRTYPIVVRAVWGEDIDYAVMQKQYGNAPANEARCYSPAICTGIDVRIIARNPDGDKISTSCVERQNLTMRMGMRRFTRLTNGFARRWRTWRTR